MPVQSVQRFTFGGVGSEPIRIRGRSIAESASSDFISDVYTLVFLDILDELGSDVPSWAYVVDWHIRTTVTDSTNANLSSFKGLRPRFNYGILQYGTTNGIVTDEILRYTNQSGLHFRFIASNTFPRQSIAVSTSTVVPSVDVQFLFAINNSVQLTDAPALPNINAGHSPQPFADAVYGLLTENVEIIYTIHYTAVWLAINGAVIAMDGYV